MLVPVSLTLSKLLTSYKALFELLISYVHSSNNGAVNVYESKLLCGFNKPFSSFFTTLFVFFFFYPALGCIILVF